MSFFLRENDLMSFLKILVFSLPVPYFSKVSPSAVPVAELVTINVSYVAMQNGKLRRIRNLVKNLVEFLKKYSKLYKGANLEAALYK